MSVEINQPLTHPLSGAPHTLFLKRLMHEVSCRRRYVVREQTIKFQDSLLLEGNNLAESAEDSSGSDERVFVEHLREGWGVRQRGLLWKEWKLVQDIDDGRTRLFHLWADPGDEHDVAAEHVEVTELMRRELFGWLTGLEGIGGVREIQLDEEMKRRLRALGYIE